MKKKKQPTDSLRTMSTHTWATRKRQLQSTWYFLTFRGKEITQAEWSIAFLISVGILTTLQSVPYVFHFGQQWVKTSSQNSSNLASAYCSTWQTSQGSDLMLMTTSKLSGLNVTSSESGFHKFNCMFRPVWQRCKWQQTSQAWENQWQHGVKYVSANPIRQTYNLGSVTHRNRTIKNAI